jgi:CDP-diacylglycerol--glycerol-3-phosphate 3-phosphatidyltransferase
MKIQKIPNWLTTLRIALIPLLVVVFQIQPDFYKEISTLIFFIAAITDFFDGYIARKYNVVSQFGKFFDPVADKLLVTISLLLLAVAYQNIWITLSALIIISREILMSSFREWIANSKLKSNESVSLIGKWKTTFQMLAIGGLFWAANSLMLVVTYLFLFSATILTLYSLYLYFKEFGHTISDF